MKVVIQKCIESSVTVDNRLISSIGKGLMVLVGFTHDDTQKDIDYLVNKVINLRIFEDENGIMNRSVLQEEGEILCISQFTLYGDAKKGNRPSYEKAMNGKDAIKLYENEKDVKAFTKLAMDGMEDDTETESLMQSLFAKGVVDIDDETIWTNLAANQNLLDDVLLG